MATMVNQTSSTLVMSAVPNVTRTRYCAAAATCVELRSQTLRSELWSGHETLRGQDGI